MILSFLRDARLHGIFINILRVRIKILLVTNLMLGKTRVPNRKPHPLPFPDLARRTALDELHGFLERR